MSLSQGRVYFDAVSFEEKALTDDFIDENKNENFRFHFVLKMDFNLVEDDGGAQTIDRNILCRFFAFMERGQYDRFRDSIRSFQRKKLENSPSMYPYFDVCDGYIEFQTGDVFKLPYYQLLGNVYDAENEN